MLDYIPVVVIVGVIAFGKGKLADGSFTCNINLGQDKS